MPTDTIILGGGCFWCTEAVFKRVKGVKTVEPGYAGGHTEDPTYRQVCQGNTGHAEVIRVTYDQEEVSLQELLEIFFQAHDPTSYHKQGNDVGSPYRSIILTASEEQEKAVKCFIDSVRKNLGRPIVTEVEPLNQFYPAEDNHKDYYTRNKLNPYCLLVIHPKLKKVEKAFKEKLN